MSDGMPTGWDETGGAVDYRSAMRRIPSPVAVVTFVGPGGRDGITSTAVCSATTEPPSLVVCLSRASPARAAIAEAGHFVVNFVTEGQSEIARQFSQSSDTQERFGTGEWRLGETGAPILADCAGSFDCRVETVTDYGAHTILLGKVVGIQVSDGSGLLYQDGFFRRVLAE